MAEYTFYPDADPESASVDGAILHVDLDGLTWAAIKAAAGTEAWPSDSGGGKACVGFRCDTITDRYDVLRRGILLFDTSALTEGATIVSATLSLWGYNRSGLGGFLTKINVYSSAPASDTDLVAGDFDSLGSVPFCDTPILFYDVQLGQYNDFILNADGLSAISKTGITKLGVREAVYDAGGATPTWDSAKGEVYYFIFADGDSDKRPKLVVTYGTIYSPGRVTELVHRYTTANVPSNKILTLEVLLGGATYGSLTVLSRKPPVLPELVPEPPSAIPIPPPPVPPPPLQDPFAEPVFEAAFIGWDPATGKEQWLMPDGTIELRDPEEQPPRVARGPSRAI